MKKIILACGLLVLGALSAGCGSKNKCEAAADTIALRLEECQAMASDPNEVGEPPACTEEYGALQECSADCHTAASCDTFKGLNPGGSVDFGACLAKCKNAM